MTEPVKAKRVAKLTPRCPSARGAQACACARPHSMAARIGRSHRGWPDARIGSPNAFLFRRIACLQGVSERQRATLVYPRLAGRPVRSQPFRRGLWSRAARARACNEQVGPHRRRAVAAALLVLNRFLPRLLMDRAEGQLTASAGTAHLKTRPGRSRRCRWVWPTRT